MAALLNQSFAEELESVSNKTLCQIVLNVAGPSNITVKVDGRDYPLPSSLYLNLGTRHKLSFAQAVPGLFQDYVYKELIVGNQTYTDPSIQLTVLEPVSVTAIYEARPSTLTITIIALALLAATAAAYTLRKKTQSQATDTSTTSAAPKLARALSAPSNSNLTVSTSLTRGWPRRTCPYSNISP